MDIVKKLKVLVIDEEVPFPLNSGKRLRTFNILKHLATRHDIVFMCREHEGLNVIDSRTLEETGIRVIKIPHPILKKSGIIFYKSLIANLISSQPYVVASHYSKPLIAKISSIIKKETFDVFHCEWTPYAVNLKPFLPLPSIIVAHNVESLIWRRLSEVETNLFKKAYIYAQWKKMEKFESKIFPLFKKIVAVSERDKGIISRWVSAKNIDVVENGVDIDFFRPSREPENPHSLVFTGSLDWHANIDGILYFLDRIWPLVLKKVPESHLFIVGRQPSNILKDHIGRLSSITLTGTVEDVRPFIERASVFIVPLRVGSGTRLKILEAFAVQKAVVSTTIGAEGLKIIPGKDLLIEDDPQGFADAICYLFKNPIIRQELGSSGRALVEKMYTWKTLADKLENIWYEAAEEKGISGRYRY